MKIIRYFNELMSSNFLELIGKSLMPIVNNSNLAQWGGVYIHNSWVEIRVRNISHFTQ